MTREEYKNKILDKEGIYYRQKYNEVQESVKHTINILNRLGLLSDISDKKFETTLESYVIDLLTRDFEVDTLTDEQLEHSGILGLFGLLGI